MIYEEKLANPTTSIFELILYLLIERSGTVEMGRAVNEPRNVVNTHATHNELCPEGEP
jgi:hypothetical protein